MTIHRSLDHCPNCKRQFYAHTEGAYCPECWSAWCRNDGTFERRTVRWADLTECPTCTGSGKEARHQLCRDCDEVPTTGTGGAGHE
ncbi:hypothetical protein [Shinella sp. HZN7]|uniref:hypothetical protein n=1 Tax=Shinella sp. (strain HZN7) TaxID=879274 RepID=UPI000AB45EB8|nr:hypothetical protein [Shinella sp. HZN7]